MITIDNRSSQSKVDDHWWMMMIDNELSSMIKVDDINDQIVQHLQESSLW
jgi:hypothetical protein